MPIKGTKRGEGFTDYLALCPPSKEQDRDDRYMLTAFSRWLPFSGTKQPERPLLSNASSDLEDDEIPRYPPFAKGLPVAPLDKVMLTQRELISRIQQTLGLSQAESDELLRPVLMNYASFVHLLPASEAHHHRGAGGLFRHGLEVAFWATQASEAIIFVRDGTPRQRRDQEPCWRFAVCLAALLHDLGKPLSDVIVTNKAGSTEWNPYAETLLEWASENGVDRYFLRWNKGRHQRHERLATLALNMILTPAVRRYLRGPGPDLMKAVVEAISGTSALHPVTQLVLKADQESVKRDLRETRLNIDEHSIGLSIEPYIIDGIRSLVSSRRWKVNVSGGEVWNLEEGVFISWRTASQSLVRHLQDKDIPAVPHDPDTLADYLIERGFAVPRPVPGSDADSDAYYRYWEVEPDPDALEPGEMAMRAKIMMLRMEDASLVFGNAEHPPATIPAKITGLAEQDGEEAGASQEDCAEPFAETSPAAAEKSAPEVTAGLAAGPEEAGDGDSANTLASCPHADMTVAEGAQSSTQETPGLAPAVGGIEVAGDAPATEPSVSGAPSSSGALLGRAAMPGFGDGIGIDLGPSKSGARATKRKAAGPDALLAGNLNVSPDSKGETTSEEVNEKPSPPHGSSAADEPVMVEDEAAKVADFATALSAGIGMDFPFAAEPSEAPTVAVVDEEANEGKVGEASASPSTKIIEVGGGADGEGAINRKDDTPAVSGKTDGQRAENDLATNSLATPRPVGARESPVPGPSRLGGRLSSEVGGSSTPTDLDALLSPKTSSLTVTATLPAGSKLNHAIGPGPGTASRARPEGATNRKPRPEKSRGEKTPRVVPAPTAGSATSIEQSHDTHQVSDLTMDIPWREHGEAGMVLKRIVKPILKREAALGVHLIKAGQDIALIWPDAARVVAKTPEALQGILVDSDMVSLGEGGVIEQERDGLAVVVLRGELAQVIHARLVKLEASIDDTAGPRENASPSGTQGLDAIAVTHGSHPARESPDLNIRPAQKIVGRKLRNEAMGSGGAPVLANSVEESLSSRHRLLTDKPAPSNSLHLIGEASTRASEGTDSDADMDISPPSKTVSPREALTRLKRMVIAGEGEWLIGSVRKEGDQLITSALALDRIASDYPTLTRTRLKSAIKKDRLGMSIVGTEQKLVVRNTR